MAKDLISLTRESRYPIDAFLFVQRGLDFTVRRIHGNPAEASPPTAGIKSGQMEPDLSSQIKQLLSSSTEQAEEADEDDLPAEPSSDLSAQDRQEGKSRHVTGQMLCLGLRDFALDQYGLMARTVLRNWRINHTEDFGKIVFAMVNAGLMQKTAEDSIRDFDAVYDFEEAFSNQLLLHE